MMTRLLVERVFDQPLSPGDAPYPVASCDCFSIHRIQWQEAYVSLDGTHAWLTCLAPDIESVRIAVRHCPMSIRRILSIEEFAIRPGARPVLLTEVTLQDKVQKQALITRLSQLDTGGITRLLSARHDNRMIILSHGLVTAHCFPGMRIVDSWPCRLPQLSGATTLSLTQLP